MQLLPGVLQHAETGPGVKIGPLVPSHGTAIQPHHAASGGGPERTRDLGEGV